MARIFVSYSHADHQDRQVAPFIDRLERLCGIARPEPHTLWLDRQILPGARWLKEIEEALDKADYGLLLLTPAFLASDFITREELPRFVGEPDRPDPIKRAVPVLLRPTPWSVVETGGLLEHQVFTLDGKAFNEQSGTARRDRFVNALFERLQSIEQRAGSKPTS